MGSRSVVCPSLSNITIMRRQCETYERLGTRKSRPAASAAPTGTVLLSADRSDSMHANGSISPSNEQSFHARAGAPPPPRLDKIYAIDGTCGPDVSSNVHRLQLLIHTTGQRCSLSLSLSLSVFLCKLFSERLKPPNFIRRLFCSCFPTSVSQRINVTHNRQVPRQ